VNTHRRWTDGFSYDDDGDDGDEDGDEGDGIVQFPTFQDDGGGFVFQRTSSSGRAEPISRSLTNEDEFRGMLSGTGGGKGEWGGNVLVWSVSLPIPCYLRSNFHFFFWLFVLVHFADMLSFFRLGFSRLRRRRVILRGRRERRELNLGLISRVLGLRG
jgi:hypothetical protein